MVCITPRGVQAGAVRVQWRPRIRNAVSSKGCGILSDHGPLFVYLSVLSKVEEGGACVVFMEPERQHYDSLETMARSLASLRAFWDDERGRGVPKLEALRQLDRFR